MIDSEIYSEIKARVGVILAMVLWCFCENGKFSATALNIEIKVQHEICICFKSTVDFFLSKTLYHSNISGVRSRRIGLSLWLK